MNPYLPNLPEQLALSNAQQQHLLIQHEQLKLQHMQIQENQALHLQMLQQQQLQINQLSNQQVQPQLVAEPVHGQTDPVYDQGSVQHQEHVQGDPQLENTAQEPDIMTLPDFKEKFKGIRGGLKDNKPTVVIEGWAKQAPYKIKEGIRATKVRMSGVDLQVIIWLRILLIA